MLEKVDLNQKADKETYKKVSEELGDRLGPIQRRLKAEKIPVMIVFEGLPAAGKGVLINRLIEPLDPRGFHVYASRQAGEEENMRPFLWRYFTKTPEDGRIAIYDRSWYHRVTVDRSAGLLKKKDFPGTFEDILSFERQMTDGGVVLIKFFLHISKEEQKKRFKKLLGNKETAWRVSEGDQKRNKEYNDYVRICEEMLQKTDTDCAPWAIIEATDKNYAAIKIMSIVADRLEHELEKRAILKSAPKEEPIALENRFKNGVLSGIDLTKSLTKEEYKKKSDELQKKLEFLHSEVYRLRIPVVLGFEGWDAGGKGGAIKRLTGHLDPRGYKVNPTAAPSDVEKIHHYLWRFWNEMPKAGHIAIFDRTWYGRVMVERIEGFCRQEDWKRAYQEINEMEAHMANFGAVVIKFWMQIDKEEQERRFNERMKNPGKQWKITDEDWRNREKWDDYEVAVNEMLVRTSTTYAPWVVVEGNCKYYARVKVLQTVVDALEKKIKEVEKENK